MESILMSYSRLFKANLIVKANWLGAVSCGTRSISIKSCLMKEDGESDGDEKPAKDKSKKNKDERSPSLKQETDKKKVKPVKVYAKKEEVPPAISSTIISQILSMNITTNKTESGEVDLNLNLAQPRNKRHERAEIKRAKMEIQKEAPGLSVDLIQATKEVAKAVGGDVEKTKSELLAKLLQDSADASATKLGNLISGMQVENEEKVRADPRKGYSAISETTHSRSSEKNDIFGAKRLNIFARKNYQSGKQILPTWEILNKRELELSVTHPPKNAFEEEIQWLKQGKAWQFPIDNEQGLDEEKQYGFNDHVFLEPLITDFPKTGPLRQFMELVLYGLSKNPYLSVPAKRESIEWFRQYFKDNAAVLQEQGVENVPLSTS